MSQNILIIEDEFLIAADIECGIQELGHCSAGIAGCMETALSLASPDIDIALVDVNLADGRTGPGIGEKLARLFGVSVIFLTANPEQVASGIKGALGVVSKPVSLSMLREILDYAIAARSGGRPPVPARMKAFT